MAQTALACLRVEQCLPPTSHEKKEKYSQILTYWNEIVENS